MKQTYISPVCAASVLTGMCILSGSVPKADPSKGLGVAGMTPVPVQGAVPARR